MNKLQRISKTFQNYFQHLILAPPDPILGTALAHKADPDKNKVNLGIGAFRTDDQLPYVFKSVKQVERQIVSNEKLDKVFFYYEEYLPIDGLNSFVQAARLLLFGKNCSAIQQKRIVSSQTIAGTGSLRIGCQFIKEYLSGRAIVVSKPTWGNHPAIIKRAKLQMFQYPYYNEDTKGANIPQMIKFLENTVPGSVILLHACAHNPTGVDPTRQEWKLIAEVMKSKGHIPYFDCAYQGYASGNLDYDAWAIRYFLSQGFQLIVSQSFSKNMGLYGQRVGAIHIVCVNSETASKVLSQIKLLIRASYSNPSLHGARIASSILNDQKKFAAWSQQLKMVANRVIEMRKLLRTELERLQTPGSWNHITDQIGMFSYTGLNEEQCDILIKKYHIYLLRNGRISMAGITSKNFKYLAAAIKDAITSTKK